jgi:hypothetical protein
MSVFVEDASEAVASADAQAASTSVSGIADGSARSDRALAIPGCRWQL